MAPLLHQAIYMDSATRIDTVCRSLRRKYAAIGAPDILALRALIDQLEISATTHVEITGNAFEGGNATGQLVFERLEYLAACSDVLAEIDATAPPPHADRSRVRFPMEPRLGGYPYGGSPGYGP